MLQSTAMTSAARKPGSRQSFRVSADIFIWQMFGSRCIEASDSTGYNGTKAIYRFCLPYSTGTCRFPRIKPFFFLHLTVHLFKVLADPELSPAGMNMMRLFRHGTQPEDCLRSWSRPLSPSPLLPHQAAALKSASDFSISDRTSFLCSSLHSTV